MSYVGEWLGCTWWKCWKQNKKYVSSIPVFYQVPSDDDISEIVQ